MTTDDDDLAQPAEVVSEYGPFPGVDRVHGVTYDGARVWFAANDQLHALDPDTGALVGALPVACDAGTAFDGTYLFQIASRRIHKIDPRTGAVVASIPAPGNGDDAGLTWADGALWVGQHRSRKIHKLDPETGAILRTLESNRFVTGVTWVDGELWHATAEAGTSEVRRVDPETGEVITRLTMAPGAFVSGLESDGRDRLFAGDGRNGALRAIRRPRRQR
jgi:glutamine cyclotransferase